MPPPCPSQGVWGATSLLVLLAFSQPLSEIRALSLLLLLLILTAVSARSETGMSRVSFTPTRATFPINAGGWASSLTVILVCREESHGTPGTFLQLLLMPVSADPVRLWPCLALETLDA